MSNLRWILLFAGFAILLLLYFSGRPRKASAYNGQDQRDREEHGAGQEGLVPVGATDLPYTGYQGSNYQTDPLLDSAHHTEPMADMGADMGANPGLRNDHPAGQQQYANPAGTHYPEVADNFGDMDPADMVRPGGGYPDYTTAPVAHAAHADEVAPAYEATATAPAVDSYVEEAVIDVTPAVAPTTLGGKLDAFSARFTSRRKKAVTSEPDSSTDGVDDSMVILLHVAAPEGQMIDGHLLLQVFEQRRYHFGEKNIFHSLHQGKTVFSIAKMVEPGFFDVDDISSFETPGLLLILQLPGPVASEAAFEVLISEARELSDALGCRVLDSKRSTLSRQTTQHLRESVSNYVHRQKYFKKANAS